MHYCRCVRDYYTRIVIWTGGHNWGGGGGGGGGGNYYAGLLLFLKLFTHGNEQSWSSMQGSSNTTWALPCHRDYQWKQSMSHLCCSTTGGENELLKVNIGEVEVQFGYSVLQCWLCSIFRMVYLW